jgi:hypothetical protein
MTILPAPERFIRGDVNVDQVIEVSDAFKLLAHLYDGLEIPCDDAADADDNETLNLTDVMNLLNLLFLNGPALASPYPAPGWDASPGGALDCARGVD